MKVCEICGEEIETRDGENRCEDCEREELRRSTRKKARREREVILIDCDLDKTYLP